MPSTPANNNKDVKVCFPHHVLPWNDRISKFLDNLGVVFVEDLKLKLFIKSNIEDLFKDEKPITKSRAAIAWRRLGTKDNFNFKNVATNQYANFFIFSLHYTTAKILILLTQLNC